MARKPSLDGFIPRRSHREIGGDYISRRPAQLPPVVGLQRREVAQDTRQDVRGEDGLTSRQSQGLTRSDIDDSLREIDDQAAAAAQKPPRRKSKNKRPHSGRKRIIKWVIICIVAVLLAGGGFLAFKAIVAGNSVFKGSLFGLVQQKKLQQDEHGRTNVLILGTSEDDPGHQGAHLTDSIMVLSIDQENKNAYMISVPRDLEVKYGMACVPGYAGKINAYFDCVDNDWNSDSAETERQTKTRTLIGDVLGLSIQYSAHVNYSVMRDVVSALGTITVDIKGSEGAPGVMDSNFDWKCKGGNAYASRATMVQNCPPNGHFIDYPNGPAELDAEHALYLAQARGDIMPTYGLGHSNFDREQDQQKIMLAIKEKAMSTGTLTNIGKVTGLIDAIGNNLRTNFDTSEIRTLIELAKDIPTPAIKSVNLLDSGIMTGNAQPSAGMYNYTQLRAFIKKTLYANGITKENATVLVLNASGIAGLAQSESDKLLEAGMNIAGTDNAPATGTYTTNQIFQLNKKEMPLTVKKLQSLYGVEVQVVDSVPGVTAGEMTDFVIILQDSSANTTTGANSH